MRVPVLEPLLSLALLAPALAQHPRDDQEDERVRHVYRRSAVVEIRPGGSVEEALRVYDAWMRGPGGPDVPLPETVMVEMYRAAGGDGAAFEKVAFLIQEGLDESLVAGEPLRHLSVSERHSVDMARTRERWIQETLLEVGRRNRWRIARSDSGNTTSGMKSDLDQTLYVFEWDEEMGAWKRAPHRDAELIAAFRDEWARKRPIGLGALDVASIEGRDRFPDPRDVEVEHFWNENARTTEALRSTPGAYTYPGAVVQQMQFRALNEILKENERAYRVYGPEGGPGGEWALQPFDPDEGMRIMFGVEPELLPGHAFGAALANLVELQHYLHAEKFETKYHLRTWEDGAYVMLLAERGRSKKHKVELPELRPRRRRGLNKEVLRRLFPGNDHETRARRRRHALALEASVDLRLIHKNRYEGDPGRVFEPLAREMFGQDWQRGDPSQLEAAAREHRRLASEFCLETVYATSEEAFRLLLEPDAEHALDPDRYRHLMKARGEAEWAALRERAGEAAHLAFLYGLFDLGATKGAKLLRRLDARFPGHRAELLRLWVGRRVAGRDGPANVLGLYRRHYEGVLRSRAAELSLRVQRYVAGELGYENVEEARLVDGLLDRHQLDWSLDRFSRRLALDPGNVDALANVLRVFVESEGDMDRTRAAIVDELVLAVPVAGQLVAASRSGLEGVVLMAAAVQYPVVGLGLVVCSLGEAGYAIYDVEVARPRTGNVVDAIYRGFVGPETRSYGGEPMAFTDGDQAHLEELEERRDELERRLAAPFPDEPDGVRRWQILKELESERTHLDEVLVPEIERLRERRARWKGRSEGAWAGGYFFESGAQKVQRPFENHLLASLKPVLSFSPAGVIDFRAEWDPATDGARLAHLERLLATETDALALLESEAEYSELLLRQSRWERAQRYLAESENVPELRHKFLRDSLYPALNRWALRRREEVRRLSGDAAANLVSPNPDAFVADFLAGNQALLDELVAMELLEPDAYRPPPGSQVTYGGVHEPNHLSRLPDDAREELRRRLYEDYVRSRELTREVERRERMRRQRAADALARRKEAYHLQAAGLAVQESASDPDLAELLAAVRLAPRRRNVPRVEATVYRVTRKGGESFDVAVQAAVTCDPLRHRPPYTVRVAWLDAAAARAAVASGSHEREPLAADTVSGLSALLEEMGSELDRGGLVALVRVFAGEERTGEPAASLAPERPRPKDGSARVLPWRAPLLGPDAVPLGEVLAYAPPLRAAPAEETPAEEGRVPALRLSALRTTREVGGERESGDLECLETSLEARAPGASAAVALALAIPERIQPGEPFSLGARLRYSATCEGEPLTVRLHGEQLEAEETVPPGGRRAGELTIAADHSPKRPVAPFPHKWNYIYAREPRAGTPEGDALRDHIVTLKIRSETPSMAGIEQTDGEEVDTGGIPRFTGSATCNPRFTAEVLRGEEVLLSLVVWPEWSLEGGLTLAGGPAGSLPDETGGEDATAAGGPGTAAPPPWVDVTDLPPRSGAPDEDDEDGDPLAVLRSDRPWKDERVQALIDEWLRVSEPDVDLRPGDTRRFRWTEWGIPVCPPSVVAAGPPEHGSLGRHECLFGIAGRLVSRRHHSLREYLERRLRGESGIAPEGTPRSSLGEALADAGREGIERELEEREGGTELESVPYWLRPLAALPPEAWCNGPAPRLEGRPVLLLFHATWNPLGDAAARRMQALADRWGPRGVAVVGVHGEPREAVERFAREHGLTLPIACDPSGRAARRLVVEEYLDEDVMTDPARRDALPGGFGLRALPLYAVLDAQGDEVDFGPAEALPTGERKLGRLVGTGGGDGERRERR